MKVDTRMMPC